MTSVTLTDKRSNAPSKPWVTNARSGLRTRENKDSLEQEAERMADGVIAVEPLMRNWLFSRSKEQYGAALAVAQKICREGHTYGVSYTCTTYADEIARAAGQSLPSSKSKPTTIFYQAVPQIDNPNTLYENVQEDRKKDKNKRFPFWNNPCYNQCESDFNECTKRGSAGFGLFGPVGGSVFQGQKCIIARSQCYQSCPKP